MGGSGLHQKPAKRSIGFGAVELDPSQSDAHYRPGHLYEATGDGEGARREVAKIRTLHEKGVTISRRRCRES